jgi:AcrR family transcriptional regulator
VKIVNFPVRQERTRNKRGEGSLLRAEIVTAATALLEKTGREDAVTLRAVAREVGIAAPSIYQHFPDREAILDAVVVAAFEDLMAALERDLAPVEGAQERLYTGCRTYVTYAEQHPQRYRVMFGRSASAAGHWSSTRAMPPEALDALSYLAMGIADCVSAGVSDSVDPADDAVALWASLHGLATLACTDAAGWPGQDRLLAVLVERVARLR